MARTILAVFCLCIVFTGCVDRSIEEKQRETIGRYLDGDPDRIEAYRKIADEFERAAAYVEVDSGEVRNDLVAIQRYVRQSLWKKASPGLDEEKIQIGRGETKWEKADCEVLVGLMAIRSVKPNENGQLDFGESSVLRTYAESLRSLMFQPDAPKKTPHDDEGEKN
jgi:hypothetical protein